MADLNNPKVPSEPVTTTSMPDVSALDEKTIAFIQKIVNENVQLQHELSLYKLGYKGPYMVKEGDRARYMSLKDVQL